MLYILPYWSDGYKLKKSGISYPLKIFLTGGLDRLLGFIMQFVFVYSGVELDERFSEDKFSFWMRRVTPLDFWVV